MRARTKLWMILGVLAILAITESSVRAQAVSSTTATVPLSLTVGESLTIQVTPPASPTTFTGSPPTTGQIGIVADGNFAQTRTLTIWAYFATNSALVNGAAVISASSIQGSVGSFNGTSGPFTAVGPTNFSFKVDSRSVPGGSQFMDPGGLTLSIPGGTGGLSPGTWTGTLNIVAQAT